MIHHIRGKIDGTIDGGIVVEANGIGYEVFIPDNSPLYLKKGNEEVKVLTAMIVKEDDVKLYGFSDKESMTVFRKLLTVSGVGAKGAMALLSAMPVNDLKQAIAFDDAATLTRANGIGKKIAQRICLELADGGKIYMDCNLQKPKAAPVTVSFDGVLDAKAMRGRVGRIVSCNANYE